MPLQTSKRNRLAGTGKNNSYKGMTDEQIKRKRAYDTKYHKTEERKQYRAELNKANAKSHKAGKSKVGDKKDQSHSKSGRLVLENQKSNRGRNGRSGKSTKK